LPGSAESKIINLCDLAEVKCEPVSDMPAAVLKSKELSESGDIVLLSPSSVSFNMFNNFEHRGTEFKKVVNELV
jgi:UDP-N-acetylmuramoylalanine-D-glutamate ligase